MGNSSRVVFERLEDRRLFSGDAVLFPEWTPEVGPQAGTMFMTDSMGITVEPGELAVQPGEAFWAKLATFRGVEGIDPSHLVATIHWGDFKGGFPGSMVFANDGSIEIYGGYTYAQRGLYGVSVQLSGGFELVSVSEEPFLMDWNLWVPLPRATYKNIYQYTLVNALVGIEGSSNPDELIDSTDDAVRQVPFDPSVVASGVISLTATPLDGVATLVGLSNSARDLLIGTPQQPLTS